MELFLVMSRFLCNCLIGVGVALTYYSGHPAAAIGIVAFLIVDSIDKVKQ